MMLPIDLLVLFRESYSILLEAREFLLWSDIFVSLFVFIRVEAFGMKEEPCLWVTGMDPSIMVYLGLMGPVYFYCKGSAFCKYVELSSANDWKVYWFMSLTLTGVIWVTFVYATSCHILLSICWRTELTTWLDSWCFSIIFIIMSEGEKLSSLNL